jgi:alkylation response protein AidB-like acyl-CoA dehydrogenase
VSIIDVESFRVQARGWLAENLEPLDPSAAPRPGLGSTGAGLRGMDHKTVERIALERKIQHKLFDGGYAGITFPKEYGGQGLTPAHEEAFKAEAARYRTPDLGIAGAVSIGVCAPTMLAHAPPEFLRLHIPKMLSAEEIWAEFFSEPEAGSDMAGIRTTATRDGDRWILNGTKIWSSGAYYADHGMCLARTNWEVPKHRGLTWFGVRTDAPGVTIEPIMEINGDAEFCQETFVDVELTDDDIIGELDQGWSVARTALLYEQAVSGGAVATPAYRRQELIPDLVALARRVGRDQDPVARQLIARAHINDFAHKQLANTFVSRVANGSAPDGYHHYVKLASGTISPIRVRIGMEIGRGRALVWEDGDIDGMTASVNYLAGRVTSIAGGTNEIQRNSIGERVLGLPREPSFDTNKPFNEVLRNAENWTGKVG